MKKFYQAVYFIKPALVLSIVLALTSTGTALAVTPGYLGDPQYQRAKGKIDFYKGYYVNALGKFVPLNGMDPVHLGDGGGSPPVYYKVDEIIEKKAEDEKKNT